MLQLGRTQELLVDRFSDIGAGLKEHAGDTVSVLLPKRYIPEGTAVGSRIPVFLYKDSEDRLIATTEVPKLELGGFALLKVVQVTKIGAFLDWGLTKDLFLPFKEQRGELRPGQEVFVTLYIDKSGRLAASTHVDRFFSGDSPYKFNDKVHGRVYSVSEEIGAFVAVDDKYFGLIPRQELYEPLRIGDEVDARVTRVRADGKLNLSIRKKAYAQLDPDGERIMEHLRQTGGILGLGDKTDAAFIKAELGLSKNAFKRAAGHLMAEGLIRVFDDRIEAIR